MLVTRGVILKHTLAKSLWPKTTVQDSKRAKGPSLIKHVLEHAVSIRCLWHVPPSTSIHTTLFFLMLNNKYDRLTFFFFSQLQETLIPLLSFIIFFFFFGHPSSASFTDCINVNYERCSLEVGPFWPTVMAEE